MLDEKLCQEFGETEVFRASRSVKAGDQYPLTIWRALTECVVMLVVVGPGWADDFAKGGRSVDGLDWVHFEVDTALRRGVVVIPVLLANTPRLRAESLPNEISELAFRKAVTFEHRHIERDVNHIIGLLRRITQSRCQLAFTPSPMPIGLSVEN
ncbi:hypothetical protein ACOBQX_29115 [Actinokineospora sp. G85]|uniref:hypothetical protein n=1 Tax=Actinokineospora sp. G85 TaxID=3406626 RepID=UPI003C77D36E